MDDLPQPPHGEKELSLVPHEGLGVRGLAFLKTHLFKIKK
jgi:hypothetical protein